MTPLSGKESPQEFGRALAQAREGAGVSLEELVGRTKISRRMLESLETGAFGRLPGETFARLFLRQYLELIGQPLEPWMKSFSGVWRRFEEEERTGSLPALPTAPVSPGSKGWGWAVGVLLVVLALGSVVVLHRGRAPHPVFVEPTPSSVLALATPLPGNDSPALHAEEDKPPTCGLTLVTRGRPCWVEVRYPAGGREARLLAADSRWDVPEPFGGVELVVGDAAALEICFQGVTLPPLGRSGEVVRVRLDPAEPQRLEYQR